MLKTRAIVNQVNRTSRLTTSLMTKRPVSALSPPNSTHRPTRAAKMDQDVAREKHTEGANEWKSRPPYRIHEENGKFDAKLEGNCHCGKVQFQLSREEPLDSKLCHCTTCQTQHGMSFRLRPQVSVSPFGNANGLLILSGAISMGSHLSQDRHQLLERPPRS